jgi:hypothetical protein
MRCEKVIYNKMKTKILALMIICGSVVAQARPEYAAEMNIVNCSACHVSPTGAGARTVNGKLFGSRDYEAGWWSKQEIGSLDVRGQDYYYQGAPVSPVVTPTQSKGLMIMNVIPTFNLPLAPTLDTPAEDHLVLSYNFAPVGQSMREAFWIHRFVPVEEKSWATSILLGDFMAPFGLMTDEHRTYTKQMVAMTNREFESGVLLSGDPSYKVHYDLATTSGFANGGMGTDTHPDSWAVFANLRHQISTLPLQVGLSYAVEGTSASANNLTATSVYGVFSWSRYFSGFHGNIQTEVVTASGWDNSTYTTTVGDGIGYFIPTTATGWQSNLNNANSIGTTTLVNWDLTRHWTLQYKYEQFSPDQGYQGDAFYRSGAGFKYYFKSNMNLITRYDHGYVNRPGLTNTDLSGIKAIGDTYFALLHIWL